MEAQIMEKRNLWILILIMVMITMVACGKDTPSASKGANLSLEVSYRTYSEILKDDDGRPLLKLKITFPVINNPDNLDGITKINTYYETQIHDYINQESPKALELAKSDKESAELYNYEFRPHTYERWAEIYYNANNIFSTLIYHYENTGGAHPNSFQRADNFKVDSGVKLDLSQVLGVDMNIALQIVHDLTAEQMIKNGEEMYFEDAIDTIKVMYQREDFLIQENNLRFFYQLYTLAPYAGGYPEFYMPLDELGTKTISMKPIESKSEERDLLRRINFLMDQNKDIFMNIYYLSMLPLEVPEEFSETQNIFPVKDDRFQRYSDFESYIRNTYIGTEADMLLSNGRYLDKNGELYGSLSKDGGVGYYVDWDNFKYKLSVITEDTARLTIETIEESPAGIESIHLEVELQKENHIWLLSKMFY